MATTTSKKPRNKPSKSVFLSGTYEDQIDCIEEVKSLMGELGIIVTHFKEGCFQDGSTVHAHDICLEEVHKVKNYLLILDRVMGSDYEGAKIKYRGLRTQGEVSESVSSAILKNLDAAFYRLLPKTKHPVFLINIHPFDQ